MTRITGAALASLMAIFTAQPASAAGRTATAGAIADSPPGLLAPLMDNVGTYSRPLSDCSDKAQPFFDQGLRLTYGYYFPEALASFQEAIRLDPDCPMAYWGAALAIGPVPNSRYTGFPDDPKKEGLKAIQKARELSSRASAVERDLIESLFTRYDDSTPDRRTRDLHYVKAMKSLLERHPEDPEAGTLYADALMVLSPWDYFWPDGSRRPGTSEAMAALERVIERYPNHPGAPHYYIHIVENSQTPEIGLPSADRLEALMPGAGHVVHMPSHIYIRVGLYQKAVEINKRSLLADAAAAKVWGDRTIPQGITTYPLSSRKHPVHAHDFLHMAAEWQGNYSEAIASANTIAEMVRPKIEASGSAQRRFVRPLLTERRFAKWRRILELDAPDTALPFVQGIWHYVRGSALVGTGKIDYGREELELLRSAAAEPEMESLRTRASSARSVLTLAAHVLAAEIDAAMGDLDSALLNLETAVRLEDGLKYVEPPDWNDPVRHLLGKILLEAGRAAEAEFVYWEALRRYPDNGWSLHGLMKSLQAQGRDERAAAVEARFKKAWAGADIELVASRH